MLSTHTATTPSDAELEATMRTLSRLERAFRAADRLSFGIFFVGRDLAAAARAYRSALVEVKVRFPSSFPVVRSRC